MSRSARPAVAPAEVDDDAWETGSGMPNQFVGYIAEPFFGTDEKYNNGEAMLFQAQLVDEDGEPVTTLKYSVGADWEADDSGATITHPTKTKINDSSRFGRLIDRIVKPTTERAPKRNTITSPEGKENGLGLLPILKQRGLPTTAASFEGLGFFWEQHKMETMGTNEDGSTIVKDVLLPTAYVGTWDDRKANGKGGTAKVAATRPAAVTTRTPAKPAAAVAEAESEEEAGDETPDVEIPAALRKEITQKAQSSSSKEFLRWAAKNPNIINLPDDVMNFVLGGGPSGFWASVQP